MLWSRNTSTVCLNQASLICRTVSASRGRLRSTPLTSAPMTGCSLVTEILLTAASAIDIAIPSPMVVFRAVYQGGRPLGRADADMRPARLTGTRGTAMRRANLVYREHVDGQVHQARRRRRPASDDQRRHRHDHPEAVPQDHQAHRAWHRPVLGEALPGR